MEIKIKKRDDGTVYFLYNKKEKEFNYDDLDGFIEDVYNKTDEVTYKTDEGLEEYKELLKEIVTESRKKDYIDAVEEAKKSREKVEKKEESSKSDTE